MANKDFLMLERECDFASDSDMEFDELDCSDPLAMSGRCSLHKGLRIEISEQPHSMRQAANIIIALHRLKHSTKVRSTEFTNHELFNIFLENVVEESVTINVLARGVNAYNKQNKVVQCTICDAMQKSLVQSRVAPVLQAVTLKGGSISQSVPINLSPYTPPISSSKSGQPVCLGIAKSNMYISCTSVSNTPSLCLEEVNNSATLKTIHESDDMERFLFLRKREGDSINTFESVKYPGWFISTSKNDSEQVDLCFEEDTERITVFSLRNQTVVSENSI